MKRGSLVLLKVATSWRVGWNISWPVAERLCSAYTSVYYKILIWFTRAFITLRMKAMQPSHVAADIKRGSERVRTHVVTVRQVRDPSSSHNRCCRQQQRQQQDDSQVGADCVQPCQHYWVTAHICISRRRRRSDAAAVDSEWDDLFCEFVSSVEWHGSENQPHSHFFPSPLHPHFRWLVHWRVKFTSKFT